MTFKWLLAVTENLAIGKTNFISYVLVIHNSLEATLFALMASTVFHNVYLVFFLFGNKQTNDIIMYNFVFIIIHITLQYIPGQYKYLSCVDNIAMDFPG